MFCLVPGGVQPELRRPAPVVVGGVGTSLVDQLALDIPADFFDTEVAFWVALTGYERHRSARAEFEALERPRAMPLRLLAHRLGDDDARRTTTAHLDLACGTDVERLAEHHRTLGASIERVEALWTTMGDPAGLPYCLTSRDPRTGLLPTPPIGRHAIYRAP